MKFEEYCPDGQKCSATTTGCLTGQCQRWLYAKTEVGVSGSIGGTVTCAFAAPTRIEYDIPSAYRLARKPDGELVLQGAYQWQEGFNYGHEWRDIPTEIL